jgi:glycosyltransferase involved in cell wall biosynthesis
MQKLRRPLTIAHITGELGFSGGEVQLLSLASGLAKRGHRNLILCPRASRVAEVARDTGLETRAVWLRSEWSPRNVWGVRAQLRKPRPDLVFLHTGRANWIGGLAVSGLGLPAISIRRMDRPVKRNLRTRWVYHSVVRRVVAISAAVRHCLLDAGVSKQKIRVIHSAVDAGSQIPQRERSEVRAQLGIPDGTVCLLAIAALVPRKGLSVLIDTAAELRGRGVSVSVRIAGDGPERAALERQVARLGLEDGVGFLGRREDVPDLIGACDVVVVPSHREGLGVAALEAMAGERPVVAASVGGLPEAVVDGWTGVLVPAGDCSALANAIAALCADPLLRERMGRAGRQRAVAEFSVERMVDAYEELCFEVVGEDA